MQLLIALCAIALVGCDVNRCQNSPGWENRVLRDQAGNEYLVNRHGPGCVWTVQKVAR